MLPPEKPLGLLIYTAQHWIRQAIVSRARPHRLSNHQFWALSCVRRAPGLAPGELGHWMLLDPPAASRLVAELVERKLVEARPDREDRRRTRLFLTEKGELLAAELQAIVDDYQRTLVRGLTDEEQRAMRTGLSKVAENLSSALDAGADRVAAPHRAARTGS
ncbi:MarR family winged helix-turn-helix transcriptional regulator [Anaeromyxobacter oryzisoli]|uniref:MarR family winged helix-turn-helix transcriptional regulator n=1 Tax=Anaeromyxobacter oryzisoli TaxID=2925408 RepID=UPI001F5AD8C3|nr:MarR family transcriptional regulator [Anaeromyxobacter sp. SG63]